MSATTENREGEVFREIIPSTTAGSGAYFERVDWLGFAVTGVVTLMVYVFTLAPEILLDPSGIFVTSATYPGVPKVPGYPVWVLYAWVFIHAIPFGNFAWRANFSSAVAGAVSCGLIALITSRGIATPSGKLENTGGSSRANSIRLVCASVAGLVFGFSGGFWKMALYADPTALNVCLLALTICLMMRWQHTPKLKRWICAAAFTYGVALSDSQALGTAILGLEFFMLLVDQTLARDIFIAIGMLAESSWLFRDYLSGSLPVLIQLVGGCSLVAAVILIVKTRAVFTRWKTAIASGFCFLSGLSLSMLTPVFSMTNPPANQAYARTIDGMFHSFFRGQYEAIILPGSASRMVEGLKGYFIITCDQFGWIYMFAAVIPLFYLRRMSPAGRRCFFQLVGLYLSLSFMMVLLLNPGSNGQELDLDVVLFNDTYLVLAVLAGFGLALAAQSFGERRNEERSLA